MEEIHKASKVCGEGGGASMLCPGVPFSQEHHAFTNPELSEPVV